MMEAGRRGPTGDTGRVGDQGRTGDTGAEGGIGEQGEAGKAGARGERGPRDSRTLLIVLCSLAAVLLLVTLVMSTVTLIQARDVKENAATIGALEREGADRRDQACRGLELNHREEVDELDRTYRFWADPPPSLKDLLENPLVAEGLRDTERAAKKDQDRYGVFVPSYCDDPGFGLPEPDPKVPDRPAGI